MRQIIAIGESVFNTVFEGNTPRCSYVGGRIANAASSLALAGLPVTMVSECADDCVGDIVVDFLKNNKVNVSSIDRYANGTTPLTTIFRNADGSEQQVRYGTYPIDRFDVMWPRINQDDIVIFGSLYAVENDQRKRLYEILQYAFDRKALVLYLPGFECRLGYSITKVMPNILENFELADVVIGGAADMRDIFPNEDGEKCYRHHMIYCHRYVHIADDGSATLFGRGVKTGVAAPEQLNTASLGWQAGFVAGFVFGLVEDAILHSSIAAVDDDAWSRAVDSAYRFAAECAKSGTNCISPEFASQMAHRLENIGQDS